MSRLSVISARILSIWLALGVSFSAQAQEVSCRAVFTPSSRPILSLAVKKLDAKTTLPPAAKRDSKNPLLNHELPFGAIDFSRLKTGDFAPAIDSAVAQSKRRLEAIRRNPQTPTFENTIEALETFSAPLDRVSMALSHLLGVKASDELRNVAKTLFAKAQALDNDLRNDSVLRERVETFFQQAVRDNMRVTKEQARLIGRMRGQFANPDAHREARVQIDTINARLNVLTSQFGSSLTKDRADFRFVLTDSKDLEGLPENLITRARERAGTEGLTNSWSFSLGEIDTLLTQSPLELVRKKAWIQRARIGQKRSNSDNRAVVVEIAQLREERAKIAGAANAATLRIQGRMAKTPETAMNFLLDLAEKYRPGALKDKEELDAFAGHEVKPWDLPYYATRLKDERFGYNEKKLREYFPLNQVLDGFFYTAKKLYGVTFTPRLDLPKWDPSVLAYEVKDPEGRHLAVIYFDYFERPGEKRSGAWATSLEQSGLVDGEARRPLVVNVANFKKPEPGEPALLSANDVVTLFHEGGHGLHMILSKTRYRTFSGTQVPWDFVEFPSQFMENYAFQSDVLDVYARHYKTGRRLSNAVVEQVQKSQNFRAATMGLAQVRLALLDLAWHTRDLSNVTDPRDVAKFEKAVVSPFSVSKTYGALSSTTFTHVFSGGYDAGYYSYKWADVLASDAFEAFQEHGLFDSVTADKLRTSILERGGVFPADQMYRDFRGRDPDPAALLRREGLLPSVQPPAAAEGIEAAKKPAA